MTAFGEKREREKERKGINQHQQYTVSTDLILFIASHVWNEKGKEKKEWRAKKQPGCSDFHYSQLKFKVHHISNYIKAELLE